MEKQHQGGLRMSIEVFGSTTNPEALLARPLQGKDSAKPVRNT